MTLAELTGPLAQFQATTATRDDTRLLIRAINRKLEQPHPEVRLDRIFDIAWPSLDQTLESLRSVKTAWKPLALDETLAHVVDEVRRLTELVESLPARLNHPAVPAPVLPSRTTTQPPNRPRLFIGSSSEGLPVAQALQANLDTVAEVTVWDQDLFQPSITVIETLVDAQGAFDFAAIVLTADDLVSKRGTTSPAPRDNLIFELGLFTGSLGRARTFLVLNRDEPIELPSDLDGVTSIKYGNRSDGSLLRATAPVATRIRQAMGLA
jgi:predicted nucleotide-binding protein